MSLLVREAASHDVHRREDAEQLQVPLRGVAALLAGLLVREPHVARGVGLAALVAELRRAAQDARRPRVAEVDHREPAPLRVLAADVADYLARLEDGDRSGLHGGRLLVARVLRPRDRPGRGRLFFVSCRARGGGRAARTGHREEHDPAANRSACAHPFP
ncbi:MAG TPA: hypothetical protein DEF51_06375 [Myxococcales bacterium]|nr:hypothetical protein [Myxococcales bacterium]